MFYEQFMAGHLRSGVSVDVYLAGLRKLAALFGGVHLQEFGWSLDNQLRESCILATEVGNMCST